MDFHPSVLHVDISAGARALMRRTGRARSKRRKGRAHVKGRREQQQDASDGSVHTAIQRTEQIIQNDTRINSDGSA